MSTKITEKEMKTLFDTATFSILELKLRFLEPSITMDFTKDGLNFDIVVPDGPDKVSIFNFYHFMSCRACLGRLEIAILNIKEREKEYCGIGFIEEYRTKSIKLAKKLRGEKASVS